MRALVLHNQFSILLHSQKKEREENITKHTNKQQRLPKKTVPVKMIGSALPSLTNITSHMSFVLILSLSKSFPSPIKHAHIQTHAQTILSVVENFKHFFVLRNNIQ